MLRRVQIYSHSLCILSNVLIALPAINISHPVFFIDVYLVRIYEGILELAITSVVAEINKAYLVKDIA